MDRGDIYRVPLDPVAGREQRGHRPVVVVSTREFNDLCGIPIVVPISTGADFARVRGFTVSLTGTGLDTHGVVRCDQPRALDLRERKATRVSERVPEPIINEILAKLTAIFE